MHLTKLVTWAPTTALQRGSRGPQGAVAEMLGGGQKISGSPCSWRLDHFAPLLAVYLPADGVLFTLWQQLGIPPEQTSQAYPLPIHHLHGSYGSGRDTSSTSWGSSFSTKCGVSKRALRHKACKVARCCDAPPKQVQIFKSSSSTAVLLCTAMLY